MMILLQMLGQQKGQQDHLIRQLITKGPSNLLLKFNIRISYTSHPLLETLQEYQRVLVLDLQWLFLIQLYIIHIASNQFYFMNCKNTQTGQYNISTHKTQSPSMSTKQPSALSTQQLEMFFSKRLETHHLQTAINLTECVESRVQKSLNSGNLIIHSAGDDMVQNLSSSNLNKHSLEYELQRLNHLVKSKKFEPLRSSKIMELTNEQHEKIVKKINKEKKQLRMKREKRLQQLQKQRKEQQLKREDEQKNSQQQTIQEKRSRIYLSIKERKQKKLKRYSSCTKKPLFGNKLLYRELQEKYINEVVLPAISEKNQRLKQIKKLKRPISIDEIRKHEYAYMARRQQMFSKSLEKKQVSNSYRPSFKSSKFQRIRIEEEEQIRANQEDKKRSLDSRLQKLQMFKRYVEANFKPHTSEAKKKEIQLKINKQNHQPRSIGNIHQLGDQYLNYSIKKAKKPDPEKNSQKYIDNAKKQRMRPNSNKPNHIRTNSLVQQNHIDRVDSILNSKHLSPSHKAYSLGLQTQRLNNLISRKQKLGKIHGLQNDEECSDFLLASIKARIGILSLDSNH